MKRYLKKWARAYQALKDGDLVHVHQDGRLEKVVAAKGQSDHLVIVKKKGPNRILYPNQYQKMLFWYNGLTWRQYWFSKFFKSSK